MKTVNNICRISALVLSAVALVLFFVPFATILSGGNEVTLIAAQLAIGSKVEVAGSTVDMAISADLLFCMILTLLTVFGGAMTFKSKGARYFAPSVGIITAIYMLVVALSRPTSFVDARPLSSVPDVTTTITYSVFVPFICIALFAAAAFGIAHLLVDDRIAVAATKGKYTIPQRLIRFLRDYKSEIKKIVWPGPRDVVKNTSVVLIMCLIVGAFIWIIDFIFGQLVTRI